jgi:hypothetical protein
VKNVSVLVAIPRHSGEVYWLGARVFLGTGISPEVMALPVLFKRANVTSEEAMV